MLDYHNIFIGFDTAKEELGEECVQSQKKSKKIQELNLSIYCILLRQCKE